jgi:alanyl-tRNA synthetase
MQGKTVNKPIYVFSIDFEQGKVLHINYLPKGLGLKEFDARTWATRVAEVLGGKVSRF